MILVIWSVSRSKWALLVRGLLAGARGVTAGGLIGVVIEGQGGSKGLGGYGWR
jgi:hypothetical protein